MRIFYPGGHIDASNFEVSVGWYVETWARQADFLNKAFQKLHDGRRREHVAEIAKGLSPLARTVVLELAAEIARDPINSSPADPAGQP